MAEYTGDIRRRGRRPADADVRRARVLAALEELESTGTPFSMQDVAERVGVSRATLYRDSQLRELIGSRGDGPPTRPVDFRVHEKLRAELESLRIEGRETRRCLREAQKERQKLQDRLAELEKQLRDNVRVVQDSDELERRLADMYAEGFSAGARAASRGGTRGMGGGNASLSSVAARLNPLAVASARRTLARALHPDLFARDPAAALLAEELLKQLNALTDK